MECDVIARGLQRLDAQDRKRWVTSLQKTADPTFGGNMLGYRNRRKIHLPGAK